MNYPNTQETAIDDAGVFTLALDNHFAARRIVEEIAAEAAGPGGPSCAVRIELIQSFDGYAALLEGLQAHTAECAVCGCGGQGVSQ